MRTVRRGRHPSPPIEPSRAEKSRAEPCPDPAKPSGIKPSRIKPSRIKPSRIKLGREEAGEAIASGEAGEVAEGGGLGSYLVGRFQQLGGGVPTSGEELLADAFGELERIALAASDD